jgi:hypothetical protein
VIEENPESHNMNPYHKYDDNLTTDLDRIEQFGRAARFAAEAADCIDQVLADAGALWKIGGTPFSTFEQFARYREHLLGYAGACYSAKQVLEEKRRTERELEREIEATGLFASLCKGCGTFVHSDLPHLCPGPGKLN